jgi:hypothetical protein
MSNIRVSNGYLRIRCLDSMFSEIPRPKEGCQVIVPYAIGALLRRGPTTRVLHPSIRPFQPREEVFLDARRTN